MIRTEDGQSTGEKRRALLKSRFIKFAVTILPTFFLLYLAGWLSLEKEGGRRRKINRCDPHFPTKKEHIGNLPTCSFGQVFMVGTRRFELRTP